MDKQHILDEIRRTAKDGVPLGRERFFKATGIRESDWKGKFWIRWNDAIKEAGFQPNEWQGAYDDEILLEKLINLIRELGHFPIAAELRMKERNDSDFPSDSTFRRIGNKQELIDRVRAYCSTHPGHDDVLAFLPTIGIEPTEQSDNGRSPEVFGFVYLMKSGRYYKIGHTNAVGRRERELAIQLPDKASTLHSIKTDDPQGIEDYWHRRFDTKRKNGEWFELDASDVKAFRRRTFM